MVNNDQCIQYIMKVSLEFKNYDISRDFLDYFLDVKGQFKADICRIILVSQNKIELKRRISYNNIIIKSKDAEALQKSTKLLLEAKFDKLVSEILIKEVNV